MVHVFRFAQRGTAPELAFCSSTQFAEKPRVSVNAEYNDTFCSWFLSVTLLWTHPV